MIINGSRLLAAAPLSPMVPTKERAPRYGGWTPNSYTALHTRLVGPVTDDGALFPSGWTPEMEDERLNKIADERASGPFVSVSLDDLTTEG